MAVEVVAGVELGGPAAGNRLVSPVAAGDSPAQRGKAASTRASSQSRRLALRGAGGGTARGGRSAVRLRGQRGRAVGAATGARRRDDLGDVVRRDRHDAREPALPGRARDAPALARRRSLRSGPDGRAPRERETRRRDAAAAGVLREPVEPVEHVLAHEMGVRLRSRRQARALQRSSPRRYLPVSQPPLEGPWGETENVLAAERQDVGSSRSSSGSTSAMEALKALRRVCRRGKPTLCAIQQRDSKSGSCINSSIPTAPST